MKLGGRWLRGASPATTWPTRLTSTSRIGLTGTSTIGLMNASSSSGHELGAFAAARSSTTARAGCGAPWSDGALYGAESSFGTMWADAVGPRLDAGRSGDGVTPEEFHGAMLRYVKRYGMAKLPIDDEEMMPLLIAMQEVGCSASSSAGR